MRFLILFLSRKVKEFRGKKWKKLIALFRVISRREMVTNVESSVLIIGLWRSNGIQWTNGMTTQYFFYSFRFWSQNGPRPSINVHAHLTKNDGALVSRICSLKYKNETVSIHLTKIKVKPKPIVARACTFSRPLCRLRVITSSFDWFTGLSSPFLIGQTNYLGFGFTTLDWNSLYDKFINFNLLPFNQFLFQSTFFSVISFAKGDPGVRVSKAVVSSLNLLKLTRIYKICKFLIKHYLFSFF